MQLKTGSLYEFGEFVLDTSRHLLLKQGIPVAITPKTYDLLLLLVQNPGRLLKKDELIATLWPNSSVEESNLTQQISTARRTLGESAGEDRFIVTVPGKGYRFNAQVQITEPEAPPYNLRPDQTVEKTPAPKTPIEDTAKASRRLVPKLVGMLAGMAVVAGIVWSYYGNPAPVKPTSAIPPRSLAILPFESLTKDPESSFLGFSLADAVITKLGAIRSLTVRPSSAVEKYRHQKVDFQHAATELHADTLLTGNYLRDGEDLRVTAQLIDMKTSALLWKGAFDLKYDRVLTVQDRVAREIVNGLQLSLSPGENESLEPEKPVDPLAYEYYLRGVDLYARNEFALAIGMLQKSTKIDPGYSLAWAHLGRSLTANASFELGGRGEYKEAEAAYQKALSLKPIPIEAPIYLANFLTDTGQVERGVPLLRDALKTNPNHAEVHWELGYAYRFAGMLNESIAECERARELDPGVKLNSSALNGYLYVAQYDQFLESLPSDEESSLILFYRGFGEYHKKNRVAAAQMFDRALEARPSLLQARLGNALSYGIRHQTERGLAILRETEEKVAARGVGDPEGLYKVAQAYAELGDKSSALRVLRKSIEGGFFSYPYLRSDPLFATIRSEEEWKRLLAVAQQRHEAFKKRFF